MHSRRAFSGVESKGEACLKTVSWAAEAMSSHHFDEVVFATEDSALVGAMNRPKAWPSFAFQRAELMVSLESLRSWKFVFESHSTNRGVSLIAQSAANYSNLHSYVAAGAPSWLEEHFEYERNLLST
ncbi:hypothetical protein V5N11_026366 [Cardamine amara subsp. amara]|uniref:RNase H type-1 domain-containing protein n=1 Tax=Cardamine amara subsp. amara TaxID=228776 RepID=A0ABD1BJ59_CARAN